MIPETQRVRLDGTPEIDVNAKRATGVLQMVCDDRGVNVLRKFGREDHRKETANHGLTGLPQIARQAPPSLSSPRKESHSIRGCHCDDVLISHESQSTVLWQTITARVMYKVPLHDHRGLSERPGLRRPDVPLHRPQVLDAQRFERFSGSSGIMRPQTQNGDFGCFFSAFRRENPRGRWPHGLQSDAPVCHPPETTHPKIKARPRHLSHAQQTNIELPTGLDVLHDQCNVIDMFHLNWGSGRHGRKPDNVRKLT